MRELLQIACSSSTRIDFMDKIFNKLLNIIDADALDIWVTSDKVYYHFHSVFLETDVCAQMKTGFIDNKKLIDFVIYDLGDKKYLEKQIKKTEAGSLWIENLVPNLTGTPDETFPYIVTGNGIHYPSQAFVEFDINETDKGLLQVKSIQPFFFNKKKVEKVYEGLGQFLGIVISYRRLHFALGERIKEITCLYNINHITASLDYSINDLFQSIVEMLPEAFQFPEITKARIIVDNHSFVSLGFKKGSHFISEKIIVKGEVRGRVEVFYTNYHYGGVYLSKDMAFLYEEQQLLQGVSRELRQILERRQDEQDKKNLEKQLHHADRLSTVGQLAAGIAHEINEPLANTLGFAQLIQKNPDLSDQIRKDIDKIVEASLYAREVIATLMLFVRQSPKQKDKINLNMVIRNSFSLLESRCEKSNINVLCELSPELPLFYGDSAQFQQIIINLIVNAIQEMTDGGNILVKTELHNECICLIVEDSGKGIPLDVIDNIFDPFFTTKDVGKGTGLGLSVVHGIIKSYGGSIQVSNRLEQGARFEINLPLTGEKV